jgi:hypothetical protein
MISLNQKVPKSERLREMSNLEYLPRLRCRS